MFEKDGRDTASSRAWQNQHYSDKEIVDILAYSATSLHASVRETSSVINIPQSII